VQIFQSSSFYQEIVNVATFLAQHTFLSSFVFYNELIVLGFNQHRACFRVFSSYILFRARLDVAREGPVALDAVVFHAVARRAAHKVGVLRV
jgi:hypothetical protein